jgi:hypothetical protein
MKSAALLFCLAVALPKIAAQEAVVPASRLELSNRKDFTGWTFCLRSNADPARTWTVTNGVIGFQSGGGEFETRKVFLEPLK